MTDLPRVINNEWLRPEGAAYSVATILDADRHPEGLNVRRLRFEAGGSLDVDTSVSHIVTVLSGSGKLHDGDELALEAGLHMYLTEGNGTALEMEAADMPYGDRQGGVRDPNGNIWWISQRVVHEPYGA